MVNVMQFRAKNKLYLNLIQQPSMALWSIRLPQFFIIGPMAAAGREFQSGIVRCQNEFCPSVVLALMCLY